MPCDDSGCGAGTDDLIASGLRVAYEADWPSVKALGARCEAAGIAVVLGPSPGKG